jgi:hypothetical protein
MTVYKGTADNPFTFERHVHSRKSIDLEGLYFVALAVPEEGYEYAYTLKPAPFTDELVRQMRCLKTRMLRGTAWLKRFICLRY